MILYLDSSALVKQYVMEHGSGEVVRLIREARSAGTSLIARAEIAAALGKAVRLKLLSSNKAVASLRAFRAQWPDIVRVHLTESLVEHADSLVWEYALRGYDAVHLASALFWQNTLSEPLTVATFDRQLWDAALRARLNVFPTTWSPGRT